MTLYDPEAIHLAKKDGAAKPIAAPLYAVYPVNGHSNR